MRLIALVMTMSRGSKRLGSQQRCCEAYCSRDDDVARLVEIALEDVDDDRDQNNNDEIQLYNSGIHQYNNNSNNNNDSNTTTIRRQYDDNTTLIGRQHGHGTHGKGGTMSGGVELDMEKKNAASINNDSVVCGII